MKNIQLLCIIFYFFPFLGCNLGPTDDPQVPVEGMVRIPSGSFRMGCTPDQQNLCWLDGEEPDHTVTLSSYFISPFEVTQGEWLTFMGNNPSFFSSCGDECPVDKVSWYEAVVFCNKLSISEGRTPCYYKNSAFTEIFGKNGTIWAVPNSGEVFWNMNAKGYRLPTEAEWEYAARGGAAFTLQTLYSGNDDYNMVGWLDPNSSVSYSPNSSGKGTHPVGEKAQNALGLYDMSGNISEWCFDWFSNYTAGDLSNPTGPLVGTERVERGGSWGTATNRGRTAARSQLGPHIGRAELGLRLAMTE